MFSRTKDWSCDEVWTSRSFVPKNPLPPQTTIFFAINLSANLVGKDGSWKEQRGALNDGIYSRLTSVI